MEFIIGIDSGGTNYRVKAYDLRGQELGYVVGKPANHHYLLDEELHQRLEKNIDNCLMQFNGDRSELRYIVCGTTGIDSVEDLKYLQDCYSKLDGINCPIHLINDAELAHYTVTGERGILVISGTGSIAVGRDLSGKAVRAGGWPLTIFGDEGSGTWVSKMALRHIGRWLDGAVESGCMVKLICEKYHIYTRNDLIQSSLQRNLNPPDIPQLGVLVNQAASEGDLYARKILIQAGVELFRLVEDVEYALQLEKKEPDFCVGLWGSNILKSDIVRNSFIKLVKQRFTKAQICMPQKEAVDGAAEMALMLYRKSE